MLFTSFNISCCIIFMEGSWMIIPGTTKIIFGTGDILTRSISATNKESKEKAYGLGFAQVEPGEVGRTEEKYKNVNLFRPVELLFSNVESVNVLIESLELIKEDFKIAREKRNENKRKSSS